jgi:hypothetical protein
MLTAQLSAPLGDAVSDALDKCQSELGVSRETCQEILAGVAVGDAAAVAEAIAAGAAFAACAGFGPVVAAGCGAVAAGAVGKVIGGTCTGQGGVIWAIKEYDGNGPWRKPANWKSISPPVPIKSRSDWFKKSLCAVLADMGYPFGVKGCVTVAYCQKPGMPPPRSTSASSEGALRDRLLDQRAREFGPAQLTTGLYPSGSVTAHDKKAGVWRIATPIRELAGEAAYREIESSPTPPAGVPVISLTDFLGRTGQLPWYRDWRVWAVTGTVAATGTGLLLWKRRKRRKRR